MNEKQSILIIEDEYNVRHLLEMVLTERGFIVATAESAEQAMKRIPSLKPSLIILDIQLPGMSGLDCCKKIRAEPSTKGIPIIFLSSHSSEVYRITGLESGADDFVTKPFSNGELIARVHAVLRRSQKNKAQSGNLLQDALFSVDLENRAATLQKKRLSLTPKEFALLAIFLKSEGKVLSRDLLSTQVWEHENLKTSRTIDVHIARLRKKLGPWSKTIQTVGKMGYRYLPEK